MHNFMLEEVIITRLDFTEVILIHIPYFIKDFALLKVTKHSIFGMYRFIKYFEIFQESEAVFFL